MTSLWILPLIGNGNGDDDHNGNFKKEGSVVYYDVRFRRICIGDEWQQVRDANHNIRKKVKHQEQQDPDVCIHPTIPLVYPSDKVLRNTIMKAINLSQRNDDAYNAADNNNDSDNSDNDIDNKPNAVTTMEIHVSVHICIYARIYVTNALLHIYRPICTHTRYRDVWTLLTSYLSYQSIISSSCFILPQQCT